MGLLTTSLLHSLCLGLLVDYPFALSAFGPEDCERWDCLAIIDISIFPGALSAFGTSPSRLRSLRLGLLDGLKY